MAKIRIGTGRIRKKADDKDISRIGELMTTAGMGALAAVLVCSFHPAADTYAEEEIMPDAVAVMSTSVTEKSVSEETREELVMPEKITSAAGEESFFEIIGEFFASVILGEG